MASTGLSQFGNKVQDLIDEINRHNAMAVKSQRYRQQKHYSQSDLAQALDISKGVLSRYLSKDANGPLKHISLHNVMRLIIALKPDQSCAYELIAIAGYCIAHDNDPAFCIYRKIVEEATYSDLDRLNFLLTSVPNLNSKQQNSVIFQFRRL